MAIHMHMAMTAIPQAHKNDMQAVSGDGGLHVKCFRFLKACIAAAQVPGATCALDHAVRVKWGWSSGSCY